MIQGIFKVLTNSGFRLLKLWLCIIACTMPVSAAETSGDEAVLKAVFIYNFAKFTHWPADTWNDASREFHVCTIGDNKVSEALSQLRGEKLKGRDVVVRHLKNLSDSDYCHLLYVADPVPSLLKETNCCQPVLTISDASGFASSIGMIELFIRDEKVRFNINLSVVRASGMHINAQLLRLAEQVIQESRL